LCAMNTCTSSAFFSYWSSNSKKITPHWRISTAVIPHSSFNSRCAPSSIVSLGSTLPPNPFHLPTPKPLFCVNIYS
jgi:hypothetical protein